MHVARMPNYRNRPLWVPSVLLEVVGTYVSVVRTVVPSDSSLSMGVDSIARVMSFSFAVKVAPFSGVAFVRLH